NATMELKLSQVPHSSNILFIIKALTCNSVFQISSQEFACLSISKNTSSIISIAIFIFSFSNSFFSILFSEKYPHFNTSISFSDFFLISSIYSLAIFHSITSFSISLHNFTISSTVFCDSI
ncbi:hypothetical protein ACFLY2_03415, partial [Patescibacteria group bacterium]